MKNKLIPALLCVSLSVCGIISCNQKPNTPANNEKAAKPNVILKDYGAEPAVLNIEAYTTANTNFRTVLWTGQKLQVTLMSIPVGGDIGLELHPETDQFLRIEEGEGRVLMGKSKDNLNFTQNVYSEMAVFVPAGEWHNIINTGNKPLKLYSIYSPVEHPHGTIHKTQHESEKAEHNDRFF